MYRHYVAALVLGVALAACQGGPKKITELKNQEEKVSYSIGLNIGKNMQQQGVVVNPDVLSAGLRDGLNGAEPLMNEEQIRETMMAFQQEMMQKQQEMASKQQEQMGAKGEDNKKASDEFLAEVAKKKGIKKTDSGLFYEVIEEGKGEKPGLNDTVTVHYKGTLPDGKEFDSSLKRGEPATFPVSGVIPGWTEALQIMKKGAKYKLYIPPDLAYGPRGAGQDIGPNQALVFEVELIDIKKK